VCPVAEGAATYGLYHAMALSGSFKLSLRPRKSFAVLHFPLKPRKSLMVLFELCFLCGIRNGWPNQAISRSATIQSFCAFEHEPKYTVIK